MGLLEKIDIHSHDLRIRDDVGNTLALTEVAKDIEAGGLIGRRVTATGFAVRSREGKVHGVQDPTIVPFNSSIPRAIREGTSFREQLETLPGPDPDGGIEMSDEEFQKFIEAIGR